jgi:murein L,D-transpeptidase YcbB/YkuD
MRMQFIFNLVSGLVSSFVLALLIGCAPPSTANAQFEPESVQQALAVAPLSGETKDWVTQFYTDRGFQPAWTARGQLTYAAEQLKNAMAQEIPAHGLVLKDYWTPELDQLFSAPINSESVSQVELALTKAFVRASVHINIGRLDLKALSNSSTSETKTRFKDVKYERRAFTHWADLQSALGSEGIAKVWNRLAPQHKLYQDLKKVLASLRTIQAGGGFKPIPTPSSTLRVGAVSPIVLALKNRAKLLGYTVTSLDNKFDDELAAIVKDIQEANLTEATGRVSPNDKGLWETLGVTCERRITQVELNMEKLRWLPEVLEPRHIFVNLAVQELNVVDPGLTNPILQKMKVIVGQPKRKTPSMRDVVRDVVLNPTWTAPSTVFVEDKVPHIRDLLNQQGMIGVTDYFSTNYFNVMRDDTPVPPESIDWLNLDPRDTDITIVQSSNYMNALGVIKVNLGNPWAIYMHDTNQRERFAEPLRALSSGCIRLQAPLDMAEYLLSNTSWDRLRIESTIAKPGDPPGSPTWAKPNSVNRLPLYTIGVTARLGDNGAMRFTRDVYSQNLYILEALQAAGYYTK